VARVIIPLAQGCEELEAVTIIDLLRRAGINVVTVGLDDEIVTAARGTRLIPDSTIDAEMYQPFDMIVLPGGLPGANHLRDDSRVQGLLKSMYKEGKHVAAICAAPKALAAAGLLNGKHATSFPGSLDDEPAIDDLQYEDEPVVVDGRIITSRGPGTAMDFALQLIEILAGADKRHQVEGPLQRPH
jgi:4-methyl-5(b-hydroxyethyl)-thiazole monophosphate biosynthesis